MTSKQSKNDIDDILAGLSDEEPTEGFNRNYFQSNKKGGLNDKKCEESKPEAKAKATGNKNYQPQIENDWEDENNDDDDFGVVTQQKKEEEEEDDYKYQPSNNIKKEEEKTQGQGQGQKTYCEIAYLGNGLALNKTICDNLLCSKCDVKVTSFQDKQWDSSVNYLFFRNNYARKDKLAEKIKTAYGTTCYSCQCTWNNISEDYISAAKVSNWICRGHTK